MDQIGEKLAGIERHLEVAGLILGDKGPADLHLGSEERARALDAVAQAFILAEELLGETGNVDPVSIEGDDD